MVTNILLGCLVILSVVAKRQELSVRYAGYDEQALTFAKYLRGINNGYFIDIGGFYPIYASNTAKLSWRGVIMQANQQRAKYHNLFEPDITTLNLAMSNVSGEIATFYEVHEAEGLSSLLLIGTDQKQRIPTKVMTINLADICHKYYKTRPIVMNIDIQGMGQFVLRSNDWKTEKCRPDLIYAEDFQNKVVGLSNIEELLRNQSYVKIAQVGPLNKIFIRQDKLQLYKKEAEKNKDSISNLKFIPWEKMSQDIGTIIGSPIKQPTPYAYRPNIHHAFIYVRQPSVINIQQLNKYSNLISEVGPNRPIFVLEYDPKISGLYLGTDKFMVEPYPFKQLMFQKINAQYSGYTLTIYIFNNQRYDNFRIRFIEPSQQKTYFQQIPDTSFEQSLGTIIFTMLVSAGIIYRFYRRQQNSILANK